MQKFPCLNKCALVKCENISYISDFLPCFPFSLVLSEALHIEMLLRLFFPGLHFLLIERTSIPLSSLEGFAKEVYLASLHLTHYPPLIVENGEGTKQGWLNVFWVLTIFLLLCFLPSGSTTGEACIFLGVGFEYLSCSVIY